MAGVGYTYGGCKSAASPIRGGQRGSGVYIMIVTIRVIRLPVHRGSDFVRTRLHKFLVFGDVDH